MVASPGPDFNIEFGDDSVQSAIGKSIEESSLAKEGDAQIGQKGNKAAKPSKEKNHGICLLCEEPTNNSSCKAHKRAYETIYRAAMADGARRETK